MKKQVSGVRGRVPGISKEALLEMRKQLFARADEILLAKGNDYNSEQQEAGDTLFNLRVCALLGIVRSPVDGILVRLSDKLMRLVSLTRPGAVRKVRDESIEDTVLDAINYLTYLLAIWKEQRSTGARFQVSGVSEDRKESSVWRRSARGRFSAR